MLKFSFSP